VFRGFHSCPAFDIQYNTKLGYPESLAIELFTFVPGRLGKHQNLHVVCAQANAVGPKVLMRLSKTKNHVSRKYGCSMGPNVSVQGSNLLSLLMSRKL
jgi:hypothetical protein